MTNQNDKFCSNERIINAPFSHLRERERENKRKAMKPKDEKAILSLPENHLLVFAQKRPLGVILRKKTTMSA